MLAGSIGRDLSPFAEGQVRDNCCTAVDLQAEEGAIFHCEGR